MWKTIQAGHWDSVKGDHHCLIEVKITEIKGNEFRTLTAGHSLQGDAGRYLNIGLIVLGGCSVLRVK